MEILKQLLILFFFGLGIQRFVQDVFNWIDPELVGREDADYFSVMMVVGMCGIVRYLKQKPASQPANKTN